tara:strand:- start:28 stop:1488 length:1461 start_codon:yes stop_codon:yes gene_type:complete
MALFKQTIHQNKVNEINKAGKHLKVINSQTELDIRVFNLVGELVLSTKVRAGFEITLPVFAKVVISAEQEQKIEMWVDENPLGYNAPTANANSLNSYKANHYGDTDEVLPFEPTRLSAKITSDQPWWYGGSNVDSDNGIPVAAGEVAEIRGAAQISAAIGAAGEYLPVNQKVEIAPKKLMYQVVETRHGIYCVNNDNKLVKVDKNGYQLVDGLPAGYVTNICKVNEDKMAFLIQYGSFIYTLDLSSGEIGYISIPNDMSEAQQPYTRLFALSYQDGKYICIGNGYNKDTGKSTSAIIIYDGKDWVHKLVKQNYTNVHFRQIYPAGNNKVLVYQSGFYLLDIDNLPDDDDSSTREKLTEAMGGLNAYMQFTETDSYMQFSAMGVNSECVVISKNDYSVYRLGYCDASVISNAGVLLLKDGQFKVTKDLGNTYKFIDAPHDIPDSSRNFYTYHKGVLFCLSASFLGYYVTEKQRITPKQTFRVLKAYS